MAADDDASSEGLEALLDLHGFTAEIGGGFWVSMKARQVPADVGRPHGLQYALSLHRPGDERLLGYDNAHPTKVGTGPAAKSRSRESWYDHKHYRDRIVPYEFVSPAKLLEDFWCDVETLLEEEGVP